AFGRHGVVFGVAFLIVNVMHVTLNALAARGDRDLLAATLRYAPWALSGATLILAAGSVHGGRQPHRRLATLPATRLAPPPGGRCRALRVRDEDAPHARRREARHAPRARPLRWPRALPVRLRRAPPADIAHGRPRPPARRDRLLAAVPSRPRRARAGHAHAHH